MIQSIFIMVINSKEVSLMIQRNLILLMTCLFMLTFSVSASISTPNNSNKDNNFKLSKIAQLNDKSVMTQNWQQLVANPSNNQQFFAINETGGVYLVDGSEIIPQPLLKLSNESNHPNTKVKLTAFALHPSFSLREQVGYNTFYTAHLEAVDHKSKTKRLQAKSVNLALDFDAVVTEWQFNLVNYQKVDLTTKREILRISVPDNKTVIKQLAFNPFIKSWNDNFGLLYIALKGHKQWQQPLFSGAILRIHPAKFGLRSFTVPVSNPFLKNNLVNDAIYLFGSQNVKQFIWPNKNSEQILLHHEYNQKQLLSYSNGGNNWRDNVPKNVLYQSDRHLEDIFIYQGRKSPYLRNKLLLLKHRNKQWEINSLPLKLNARQKNKAPLSSLIWQFPAQPLSTAQRINIISNDLGEMLLFDKSGGTLYQFSQQNIDFITPVSSIEPKSGDSNMILFLLLFLSVALLGYYFVKRNKFSAKALVKQQFSHLEVSESQLQISLYRRHENNAEAVINIIDIESCELFLNERSISLINTIMNEAFSNEKEHNLRVLFTKEHIDKMVDGKVRVISLQIIDKHKKQFVVCLYLRKGSNRMTKKDYFNVIDELIDWCWLIAKKINPEQTGIRTIKPDNKAAQESKAKREAEAKIPLHTQAAAIRPATHKVIETGLNDAVVAVKNIKQPLKAESLNAHTNSAIDTELVNALEKLVNLKQQGYLTTIEFTKAKEKLLQNLFDK